MPKFFALPGIPMAHGLWPRLLNTSPRGSEQNSLRRSAVLIAAIQLIYLHLVTMPKKARDPNVFFFVPVVVVM